ncbi:hypothetical protein FA95DRAFT_1555601 [Auriscalpium vulgare]|uniref:Uncharacterized protein n=1 Tax=Auriscalpium vulgare TaxID=40419 RepID=A0ACB8S330_9AGAM|nr:hypothetical protein FA95DRAFT_1555601 [Auriscalpium vulgare]
MITFPPSEALRSRDRWFLGAVFCAGLVLAAFTYSARRRWATHPGARVPEAVGVELLGMHGMMGGTALLQLLFPPPYPRDQLLILLPILLCGMTLVDSSIFSSLRWNRPGRVATLMHPQLEGILLIHAPGPISSSICSSDFC